MNHFKIFFSILGLIFFMNSHAQISGCTDPFSCSFNESATIDDGSCLYEDCAGVCGGSAFVGAPCDDGDANTENDRYTLFCQCVGETINENIIGCTIPGFCNYNPNATISNNAICANVDCMGVCGGPDTPFSSCDDGDPATIGDSWGFDCVCAGFVPLVWGCDDPEACNFDPDVTANDGSCAFSQWYFPEDLLGGAATLACTAPPGYVLAESQCCANIVAEADGYCSTVNWDSICYEAYLECAGDEFCNDPLACNYSEFAQCGTGENCAFQNWRIPVDLTHASPLYDCQESSFAYIIACQPCFDATIDNDSDCLSVWGADCQTYYENCLSPEDFGCTDPAACNYDSNACVADDSCIEPEWYYPVSDIGGLAAVYACSQPEGYLFGDQCCMGALLISTDMNLGSISWYDNSLDSYYFDCVEDCGDPSACNYNPDALCANTENCTYPTYHLPINGGFGVPYIGCNSPPGYAPVENICCYENVIGENFCAGEYWGAECEQAYQDCLNGCADIEACNYSPFAGDEFCSSPCEYAQMYVPIYDTPGNPEMLCEPTPGYALADMDCLNRASEFDDYNCTIDDWSQLCKEFYFICTNEYGCTDENACNYNDLAYTDDGSCYGISGCTDEDALNFDPEATCPRVLCVFASICPGDFNSDGEINATDLLSFLGSFGTSCEP